MPMLFQGVEFGQALRVSNEIDNIPLGFLPEPGVWTPSV